MPKWLSIQLSKEVIDKLRCPAGVERKAYWHRSLPGFGVIVFRTGKKTFVFNYRQGRSQHRIKLGEYPNVTFDAAQRLAKKYVGQVAEGKDPAGERQAERAARTLREVASEFMKLHVEAKRKAKTYRQYDDLLRLHLLPELGSRVLA